jgi:hypothetical protein
MARTSNNTGAQSPVNPADEAVKTETPDTGATPSQEGTAAATEGTLTDQDTPGTGADPEGTDPDPEKEEDKSEKPNDGPTPQGPAPDGKVKVKHESLKGKKITLPTGEIAAFDENGILEVDVAVAEYLLSIPGYEKG